MKRKSGMTTSAPAAWEEGLVERLQYFVARWRSYAGSEQAGAQDFLSGLLDIYAVEYVPGTIFEQHPVKVPARGRASQGSLFGEEAGPSYTTERMDMYLPKVCVWEMKSPSERVAAHPDRRWWAGFRAGSVMGWSADAITVVAASERARRG